MTASTQTMDLSVFRRYAGLSLPRHVSYPMPNTWDTMDRQQAECLWTRSSRKQTAPGLSLYLHIPFCNALCKFCACTRVVLPQRMDTSAARVDAYLSALEQEISRVANLLGRDRVVEQIHWGGGSPTYLTSALIERIQRRLYDVFHVSPAVEVSMEIDPRTAPAEKLRAIRGMGFNRVSLGVQDFSEQVQKHVRRIQSLELVRQTVATCRELDFDSVNFDLIYGLPYQTHESVRETIAQTIALSPDRVAYYHYAQIPEKIATQRGMDYTKLPDSEAKLGMFLLGVDMFESAGYRFVGLDHFAKPDEGLARAGEEGTLQRTFQGMTTGGGLDLIGLGASSIGHLDEIGFLQNEREVDPYVARLADGDLPIVRGKELTRDDLIRQSLLSDLYCSAAIHPARLEERFGIVFSEYFARELRVMEELQRDGLVVLEGDGTVHATMPLGRVLLRTVAAVFDAYLDAEAYRVGDQKCFSANA